MTEMDLLIPGLVIFKSKCGLISGCINDSHYIFHLLFNKNVFGDI